MLVMDFINGGGIFDGVLGIAVAFFWYFSAEIYPRLNRNKKRLLETPSFMLQCFPSPPSITSAYTVVSAGKRESFYQPPTTTSSNFSSFTGRSYKFGESN